MGKFFTNLQAHTSINTKARVLALALVSNLICNIISNLISNFVINDSFYVYRIPWSIKRRKTLNNQQCNQNLMQQNVTEI